MPMLQYPIEEDELTALLNVTGAKTGNQALRTVITGYMELMDENQSLKNKLTKLHNRHRELDSWARQLSSSLAFFQSYPSENN